MSNWKWRVGVGIVCAFAVTLFCLNLGRGWLSERQNPYGFNTRQKRINLIAEKVREFQQEKGRLPHSLSEIKTGDWAVDPFFPNQKFFPDEKFRFERRGNWFRVGDLGMDDRRGGRFENRDLWSNAPIPEQDSFSLREFLFVPDAIGMIGAALFCGACAFYLGFVAFPNPPKTRNDWLLGSLGVVALVAVSAFVASIVVLFHAPTGH